jgi:hypothetical protein
MWLNPIQTTSASPSAGQKEIAIHRTCGYPQRCCEINTYDKYHGIGHDRELYYSMHYNKFRSFETSENHCGLSPWLAIGFSMYEKILL